MANVSETEWEDALQRQVVAPWVGELPAAAIEAAALETGTPFGSHTFAEHRRCGRAFQLARSGIVPKDRIGFGKLDYFEVGAGVHACLAYAWGSFKAGTTEIDPIDALRARTQLAEVGVAEYDEVSRLVSAYFAHYGMPDFPGWEYVAIEELLQEPSVGCRDCDDSGRRTYFTPDGTAELPCRTCSGRGYVGKYALPYTARLDLVARDVDGEIVLVDTKTRKAKLPDAAGAAAEYRFGLRTNPQFLGQASLAMARYGLSKPPAVVVNAIVKTKIPGFGRVTAAITLDDVRRWEDNHEREAAATRLADDRMNYSQCAPAIGSPCRYIKWCHGSEDQRRIGYEQRNGAASVAPAIEE